MPLGELQRFRESYPMYRDVPDQELARRIVEKYPQYSDILGDVARGKTPAAPTETQEARRDSLQAVGGTIGAIGGGLTLGPAGAVIGAGVGAAVGEGASQLLNLRTSDPVADMVVAGTSGALLEGPSQLVGAGVRAVSQPLRVAPSPGARSTLDAFREVRVDPKLTDITGSRFPHMLERATVQTPGGGQIIQGAVERQAGQLSAAAQDYFLARLGPDAAVSSVETGKKVAAAVTASVEKTRGIENVLFNEVARQANDLRVNIDGLKSAAARIAGEQKLRLRAQRSGTLTSEVAEILKVGAPKEVESSLLDEFGRKLTQVIEAPSDVPWQQARAWQKAFGEAIERGELISKTPRGEAKLLFGAVSDDMERAATGRPEILDAFRTARDYAAKRREMFRDSAVSEVLSADPEKVLKTIDAAGGPTAIRTAKRAIDDPEAWNYVRRHIFEGVLERATDKAAKGLSVPIISGAKLERELTRIGKESLDELLEPTERRALDNLRTVATAIRSSERIGSIPQSATFQNASVGALFTLPGTVAGAAVGFPLGAPGTGALVGSQISFLFTPSVAAKILTNPRTAELVAGEGFKQLAMSIRLGGRLSQGAADTLAQIGAALFATPYKSEPVVVGGAAREAAVARP